LESAAVQNEHVSGLVLRGQTLHSAIPFWFTEFWRNFMSCKWNCYIYRHVRCAFSWVWYFFVTSWVQLVLICQHSHKSRPKQNRQIARRIFLWKAKIVWE